MLARGQWQSYKSAISCKTKCNKIMLYRYTFSCKSIYITFLVTIGTPTYRDSNWQTFNINQITQMQRSLVVVGINSCSKLSDFNLRNSLRSTIYHSEKCSLQNQRNRVYRLREIQFTDSEKYSLQNHRNTVYRIREIQNGKITIYPQSASNKSHQPKYQNKHRI